MSTPVNKLLVTWIVQFMGAVSLVGAATSIVAEGVRFALDPTGVSAAEQLGATAFAAVLLVGWRASLKCTW